MFLGQKTPAEVLAAAEDPEAQKKKSQVCEANFYGGELALRQGSKDEAARLFRLAATDCPYSDMERHAASQEFGYLFLRMPKASARRPRLMPLYLRRTRDHYPDDIAGAVMRQHVAGQAWLSSLELLHLCDTLLREQ